ncbi:LysR substrate-binding domain-containing protein [Phenylobacterium sp. SCN 70-31]|uniref:LysR substrate-binding domain-containing protein n=1 Tax=Phenylobacterium sp. SCN 70-31 TaxID=1660129 RepID=UPI00086D54CB|nr:LysR substrate-binding domain-containing protein [Phenylobacterium sp. SCN 70-31]ODT84534.1 MAG: LysR family transcriptional regulator [Phenylobacterium sp. SCN 70-31]
MRFDLTDLRLFSDVADAGSITAGAEKSALALAAASTRIRNMEAALGASLLTRSRQGVTLTPAGRTLLMHARTILGQAARMREDLSAFAGGLSGEVRLLANTNALTEFLPEALSSFLAAHPHVSVDLEEKLSDEIVGLIAEGVGDIGIVAGTVEVGALETFPFRSDRFVVVAGRGHPLAGRTRVSFAEVLAYDLVGLERSSSLQRFLVAKAARAGAPFRARVQLRSFDAVCRLVEAGVGVGVAPATTAYRAARTMALDVIELADDWARRDLNIVVRSLDGLRPYARALADALRG